MHNKKLIATWMDYYNRNIKNVTDTGMNIIDGLL